MWVTRSCGALITVEIIAISIFRGLSPCSAAILRTLVRAISSRSEPYRTVCTRGTGQRPHVYTRLVAFSES